MGSFFSCAKRVSNCPCDNNNNLGTIKGEVRLFIDETTMDNDVMVYVSYFPDVPDYFADYAYLRIRGDHQQFPGITPSMPTILHICNFPDFAKEWDNSEEIIVYYEGTVYPNCEAFLCRTRCYTLVLTELTKN